MAFKISIYKGTVTANGTDGTEISETDFSNALDSGYLLIPETNPSYTEGDWIRLAVRCDTGLQTVEDLSRHVRISLDGSNSNYWELAPDDGSGNPSTSVGWNQPLDITTVVTDVNTLFHVRARCEDTESVMNDKTCEIIAQALIETIPPEPWTLSFDNLSGTHGIGYNTNNVTVVEAATLHFDYTGNILDSIMFFYEDHSWDMLYVYDEEYSSHIWFEQTKTLNAGTVFYLSMSALNAGVSTITVRENDGVGRILGEFTFTAT